LILLLSLVYWFYISIGENTWDGSAYHLPIEQLAATTGSLFGWQDFIYAQWQQSTFQIASAFYDVLFNNLMAGSVVSLTSFIFLSLLFSEFTKLPIKISTIFLLTIPAVFHQIGSRYIDLSLATALFSFFLVLRIYLSMFLDNVYHKRLKLFVFFPLMSITAILVGSKSSAFVPVFVLLVICLWNISQIQNRILLDKVKFQAKLVLLVCSGAIFGSFPVFLRNVIEFGNPLYPYKVFFFENGLFGLNKVSNFLSEFYAQQVGLNEDNFFFNTFYQYIFSPFLIIIKSISELDFNFTDYLAKMSSSDFIYRTFVYDNRLGGFGILFSISLMVYVLRFKSKKELVYVFIGFIFFSIAPTSIHPRYYLGIGIIVFAICLQKLKSRNLLDRTKLLSLLLTVSIFWNLANLSSFYFRTKFNPLDDAFIDRNSAVISQRINPDCIDSIHVGSGLWATTGIFGPNSCSIPFYSLNMGGSLIDVNIGPSELSLKHLEYIYEIITTRKQELLIVCTHPKNKLNPCQVIYSYLGEKQLKTLSNEGSEAASGPSWSTILVKVAK
jgi:hypothetical protein